MRDEQVQQLLCLLCLSMPPPPLSLPADRYKLFSGGHGKHSSCSFARPAFRSTSVSGALAYACPDAAQQYATRIIKMLLSNAPHFLSSPRSRHTRHQMAHSCHYNCSWKAMQRILALLQSPSTTRPHPVPFTLLKYYTAITLLSRTFPLLKISPSCLTKPLSVTFAFGVYQGHYGYCKTMGAVINREITPCPHGVCVCFSMLMNRHMRAISKSVDLIFQIPQEGSFMNEV